MNNLRRDLVDLTTQRTARLEAAQAALDAGNQADYDSAMADVRDFNGRIQNIQDLITEQDRQIMAAPAPAGAEARDMAEERGHALMTGKAVTFTADFQKIFGPLSYFTTASKYQAQIDSGELTGEALTNAKAALSNAYLDGVLSVFFLVMMGVFVVVGIVVVARTFAAGKYGAETTSEEPFVESQWFAPSSLVATALEKKVQREYSAKLQELRQTAQANA